MYDLMMGPTVASASQGHRQVPTWVGLAYKRLCLHHRHLRQRKAASGLDLTEEQADTDL